MVLSKHQLRRYNNYTFHELSLNWFFALWTELFALWTELLRWENSRHLCKPETKSRVCITVENSPNPSSVYIRLCKHRKKVSYCFYKIHSSKN